jgi:aminoglycoside phosphotransferase family enzyme
METRVPTLDDKLAFLRDPASYADGTSVVESIETHFAWLFLTTAHAYKLKKPVRHQCIDYVTLAAREQGCREEVRLNRRLAPTIYEGVVPLAERNGRLVLGAGERVHDWLVQMTRLPSARMLDHALRLGTVTGSDMDHIARTLATFFDQAIRSPIEDTQYLAKLGVQARATRAALSAYGARLPQGLVAEVERLQLGFIRDASDALGARGARVVEGHGDLRAEHVYLGPPVAVIDCLEFDRELRLLDPAEEIALLALEIAQLGRADLAERLSERFSCSSAHPAPPCVCEFYASQRAVTRAKLAAWHLDDPAFADPRPWIARTESLLAAAADHARRASREIRGRQVATAEAKA